MLVNWLGSLRLKNVYSGRRHYLSNLVLARYEQQSWSTYIRLIFYRKYSRIIPFVILFEIMFFTLYTFIILVVSMRCCDPLTLLSLNSISWFGQYSSHTISLPSPFDEFWGFISSAPLSKLIVFTNSSHLSLPNLLHLLPKLRRSLKSLYLLPSRCRAA